MKSPSKASLLEKKSNFLKIKLDYNFGIILPYKAGIQFMATLENAEEYLEDYNVDPKISPIKTKNIESSLISEEQYLQLKMAALK